MKGLIFTVTLQLMAVAAMANSWEKSMVPSLGSGVLHPLEALGFAELLNDTYQIGEEWGKLPVTEQILAKSPVYRRAAGATARVGGATGFYIGEFAGTHVVATNNHVCPSDWRCRGSVSFPVLQKTVKIESVLGSFPEIDLALVAISPRSEDVAALSAVAANFSYSAPVKLRQKLLTIGFGVANNRSRNMVANFDTDCVVFSRDNEFRQMADPDALNPGEDLVWSFSNGCDVSHGDSGSAMVDRENGRVVGIIWTGKIPKNARVRNGRYLQGLLENPSEETWQELSYAVPAAKIKEVLSARLANGSIREQARPIVKAVIQE